MKAPSKTCIDTDVLVNLLGLGCFSDALACLACEETSCFRLPSVVAQIERGRWMVVTGDGRMIRALHQAPRLSRYLAPLSGRIVLFPQIIAALARRLSIAEMEFRWRAAAPETTRHRQKSLAVMFGTSSPTLAEDFWEGCAFQISNITDLCGEDWLFSL